MKDDDNDGFSPSYGVFADISSLIAMLKHNKGFAFLPADSVAALITSGQLVELSCDFELTAIARKVELCWRSGFTLCEIGRQVINTFKQHNQLNS
ncbi:substrate-binding domain-containing protein [Shewanella sp. SNU WT4]|uniref:substrate-binding domain-containing protein n=1 Tax=Shewanella sp. SNU WT4 TaxID=2590015 RepID=UPI001F0D42B4|nr:substrate-binding domain-containing protein [Shewanella sp. SNU WT4]